jgi:hypothetical protein
LISGYDAVKNDVCEISILSKLETISRDAGPKAPPQIHGSVCWSLIDFLRGAANERNENEQRGG